MEKRKKIDRKAQKLTRKTHIKRGFNAETKDFNQGMVCRAPVCWSKYTTETHRDVNVFGTFTPCRFPDGFSLFDITAEAYIDRVRLNHQT